MAAYNEIWINTYNEYVKSWRGVRLKPLVSIKSDYVLIIYWPQHIESAHGRMHILSSSLDISQYISFQSINGFNITCIST